MPDPQQAAMPPPDFGGNESLEQRLARLTGKRTAAVPVRPGIGQSPQQLAAGLSRPLTAPVEGGGINRALVSPEKINKTVMGGETDRARKNEQNEMADLISGHGSYARVYEASLAKNVDESIDRFTSSLTSPLMLALTATTAGGAAAAKAGWPILSTVLKTPGVMAGAGFSFQGLKAALMPKQQGESDADVQERRLFGLAGLAGGMAGTAANINDGIRIFARRYLGLNHDFAGIVAKNTADIANAREEYENSSRQIESQKSAEVKAAEAKRDATIVSVQKALGKQLNDWDDATGQKVADIQDATAKTVDKLKGSLPVLDQAKAKLGSQILADTSQALQQEQARVSAPFEEIGEKIKSPVTTFGSIHQIIEQSFTEMGAQKSEIPGAATKAMPKTQGATPFLQDSIETQLKNIAPANRAEFESILQNDPTLRPESDNASFNDLTRVREDLAKSATASTDGTTKRALYDAYNKITDMQEKAAEAAGQGKAYQTAKQDYMAFRRGIGSPLVDDWLAAHDAQDQAIAPKIAKLLTPATAEALRGILKSVGIDVSPLDDILSARKSTAKAIPETTKQGVAAVKAAREEGESIADYRKRVAVQQVKDAQAKAKGQVASAVEAAKEPLRTAKQKADAIRAEADKLSPVHGKTNEELQGKTDEQLKRMMMSMKGAGIAKPSAMINIMYGLTRLAMLSPWGIMALARGVTQGEMDNMIQSPKFQDWVLQQSGVDMSNKGRVVSLRKAVGSAMREAIKTGLPAGAASSTAQQKVDQATQ